MSKETKKEWSKEDWKKTTLTKEEWSEADRKRYNDAKAAFLNGTSLDQSFLEQIPPAAMTEQDILELLEAGLDANKLNFKENLQKHTLTSKELPPPLAKIYNMIICQSEKDAHKYAICNGRIYLFHWADINENQFNQWCDAGIKKILTIAKIMKDESKGSVENFLENMSQRGFPVYTDDQVNRGLRNVYDNPGQSYSQMKLIFWKILYKITRFAHIPNDFIKTAYKKIQETKKATPILKRQLTKIRKLLNAQHGFESDIICIGLNIDKYDWDMRPGTAHPIKNIIAKDKLPAFLEYITTLYVPITPQYINKLYKFIELLPEKNIVSKEVEKKNLNLFLAKIIINNQLEVLINASECRESVKKTIPTLVEANKSLAEPLLTAATNNVKVETFINECFTAGKLEKLRKEFKEQSKGKQTAR